MIKISAVGDIFLGDYTISLGYGIRSSIYKYGYEHHFKNVRIYLNDSDIIFGNLETIISDIGKDENDIKSIICRGENEFINTIQYAGFNALNISNNHILQHGVDAFQDTINILKNNSIDVIGLRGDNKLICKPVIKVVNGRKIGVLGYSFVNENFLKGELLYACGKKEEILHDIEILKKETDYVIVSCHWGIEYIDKPSPNIRRMAREMVDSGASIILGHHPHVVQGIEKYRKSIIFYSLGNFLFDFLWNRRSRESIIAQIYLCDDKIEYDINPVFISNKYQVLPMNRTDNFNYKEYIHRITKELEIEEDTEIEDYQYNYYVKAYKEWNICQAKKLIYMIKNFYRLDKRFIKYILKKL
jgi:poly-gamma-glutamate synthesis protein (capsule biosynthesis protein)